MSQPKRYFCQAGIRSWEIIDTGEDFDLHIMFADVCSKQDAERLCKRMNDYAALAAENERLRKAGGAMAFNYEQMHSHDGVYDSDLMKFVNAWLAAKEGRDAK